MQVYSKLFDVFPESFLRIRGSGQWMRSGSLNWDQKQVKHRNVGRGWGDLGKEKRTFLINKQLHKFISYFPTKPSGTGIHCISNPLKENVQKLFYFYASVLHLLSSLYNTVLFFVIKNYTMFRTHVRRSWSSYRKNYRKMTIRDRTDPITQTDSNKYNSLCFEQEVVNQSQKEVKRFLTASQYSWPEVSRTNGGGGGRVRAQLSPSSFFFCSSWRHRRNTFRDRRPCTTACQGCLDRWGRINWKSVNAEEQIILYLADKSNQGRIKVSCTGTSQAQRTNQGKAPFICTL